MDDSNERLLGMQFPSTLNLRIIGSGDDLEALVWEIASRHIPGLQASAVSLRPSREGKYLSVTVRMRVETREQLEAMMVEFNQSDQVILVL